MQQKLWFTICVCLVISLFSGQSALADDVTKIGTMNLQRVLGISKTGQAVKKTVTDKFDVYQEKLRLQEETLLALQKEIEKKSAVWSEDVKLKKEREFKRLVQDLEEESKYAANDMKEFEKQQVGPILQKLEAIIDEYGKEKGYALILDTSKGVLYLDESIDVSDELAVELDKQSLANN